MKQPAKVSEIGINQIENVNKALTLGLKGDVGTQNINRILRVPGTFNFKLPDNPREVTVVIDDGPKYDINEFEGLMNFEEDRKQKQREKKTESINATAEQSTWDHKITSLKVSDRIKNLIIGGRTNAPYLRALSCESWACREGMSMGSR